MSARNVVLAVPAGAEGIRLDRFLTDRLDGPTRSALRRWIDDGRVLVDGTPAGKAGQALVPGSTVEVRIPAPTPDGPLPEAIPLEVVHEDDELVVVDKPAGMTVHAGHGVRGGTLVNALLGRGVRLAPAGGALRPGIVHRLDRDTSGLVVVAKTDAAHRALAAQFARRDVVKIYRAIVWGHPDPPEGSIDRPIGRSPSNRTRMAVSAPRSRPARTDWATEETLPGFALLRLRLHTGRTHQIRVHLAALHHPVVGDARYAGPMWRGVTDPVKRRALAALGRHALHAAELRFAHPASGAAMTFASPLPLELRALLETLRRTP